MAIFPIEHMESCIFCESSANYESVEHIVPRSLGNLFYVLPRGKVCARCNNRFAQFENRVLSSKIFYEERKRLGLLRARNSFPGSEPTPNDFKKFLLKIGYESLYKSKKRIFDKYDLEPVLDFLLRGKENSIFELKPLTAGRYYKAVPKWINHFRLIRNKLVLQYAEHDGLYFYFQFGRISTWIRMA